MYPSVVPVFGASDGEMETAWSELLLLITYNVYTYDGRVTTHHRHPATLESIP